MDTKGLGSKPKEPGVWVWYVMWGGCVYVCLCTTYITWRILCAIDVMLRQLFS